MAKLDIAFADKIVQSCFDLYNKLPKTGKPIESEWTVLSCIVKHDKTNEEFEVVSLGTGSKCIGASKMSPTGDILNDSHAEVFARRGFLLYLYENIEKALDNQLSVFNHRDGQFQLKEDIEFIFYSSQLPCGDASIIPKTLNEEHHGQLLPLKKRKTDISTGNVECKRPKLEEDIHRTGAKCLPDSQQDAKGPGSEYHVVGQVRTKPGRGDRTLSVSCSDKIAKWIHMGIQGSLLHMLCGSVYIKHFIFGAGVPYSEEALNRALLNRSCYKGTPLVVPEFYQSTLQFSHIRKNETFRGAPGSIVWIKLNTPILEVAVQGKRLGVTKKKAGLPSNSLCISKYNIFKRFIDILYKHSTLKQAVLGDGNIDSVPYNEMKKKATKYTEEWVDLKENFFKSWTVKPDMWNFHIGTFGCVSM